MPNSWYWDHGGIGEFRVCLSLSISVKDFILALVNGQAETKGNCTMGDRNAISICALDLQNAGLLGNPEYLLAISSKNLSTEVICGKYTKFHDCATKHIGLCLDTELRYNHYLISVEAWAMLCSRGFREANQVIDCLASLTTSDKFKVCENIVKEQGMNMLNYFSNTDEKVCNLLDGNLNCLKFPMTGKCGVEPFQILSSSYKGPISRILKNCSVTAEIKPTPMPSPFNGSNGRLIPTWIFFAIIVGVAGQLVFV